MNKRIGISALFLAFFLYSCQQDRLLEFKQISRQNYPSITINDPLTKFPLRLSSGERGDTAGIYYLTSKGKSVIKGRPLRFKHNPHYLEVIWLVDGRDVTVRINREGGCYRFSFSASPDKDILAWGFTMGATADEYFTGLFEREFDGDQKESRVKDIDAAMNLRGQQVEMINIPTLSVYCPFYLSSNGYGLFIEGTWPGRYDFCKSDPELVKIEIEGPSLSGRIYTSEEPAEIVQAHSPCTESK